MNPPRCPSGLILLTALMLVTALLGACGITPVTTVSKTGRPGGTGTLEVTVTGVESADGQVMINVFLVPDGFPDSPELAFANARKQPTDGIARATFTGVPAGEFAVSALHDLDLDEIMDTNWIGIPTERWGVSRDTETTMSKPTYENATLQLTADETLRIEVQLR